MFSCIVVGTDGSSTATAAVQRAADLASGAGAALHLVSAYKIANLMMASPEGIAMGLAAQGDYDPHKEAENLLEETATKVRVDGVNVLTYAVPGDPADALIDVAEQQGADLIVVGNKGMSGVKRFLLGSVPNKVAHHAPCTVMIVRTT